MPSTTPRSYISQFLKNAYFLVIFALLGHTVALLRSERATPKDEGAILKDVLSDYGPGADITLRFNDQEIFASQKRGNETFTIIKHADGSKDCMIIDDKEDNPCYWSVNPDGSLDHVQIGDVFCQWEDGKVTDGLHKTLENPKEMFDSMFHQAETFHQKSTKGETRIIWDDEIPGSMTFGKHFPEVVTKLRQQAYKQAGLPVKTFGTSLMGRKGAQR